MNDEGAANKRKQTACCVENKLLINGDEPPFAPRTSCRQTKTDRLLRQKQATDKRRQAVGCAKNGIDRRRKRHSHGGETRWGTEAGDAIFLPVRASFANFACFIGKERKRRFKPKQADRRGKNIFTHQATSNI
ncbi:MAG: hypothetical protein IJV27_03210 [Prevotella sp.]|nr:hypothetical protein [Prevotella sp.]